MTKIQTQGVHHITFVGSNREAIIDFYQGVLGMPLVFEQPNLDVPEENHLYFDAGDGRLITFFVRPTRVNDPTPNPQGIGNLHHIAFTVSRATYTQVAARLKELGIENTGPIDRGFMDSIYFRDPERAAARDGLLQVRPAGRAYRRRCAQHRLTACAWRAAITTSPTSTWPMPSPS